MLAPKCVARGCVAAALSVALVPAVTRAAPTTQDDVGGTVVLLDRADWESADEIARAVRVGDGRPTLLEFQGLRIFA